jgi:hypothetical protein
VGDNFMIGNTIFGVDADGNIHVGEPDTAIKFKATKGLWELLTRKKVDKDLVTEDDLQKYKNILELSNAHLERYEPGANIQISKGAKFRGIISKLFFVSPVRRDLRQQWMTY